MGYQPLPHLLPVTHPHPGMAVVVKYPNGYVVDATIVRKGWFGRWVIATQGPYGAARYTTSVSLKRLYWTVTVPSKPPGKD